ncbi:MAG: hypothetical protein KF715_03220 [Candidatus Didemnitutus sp.]|nr:hypothetical protein [Candidatus Didemnitutus sp.]
MSDAPKLICLVTSAPLADALRVAQQADALQAAGYRVHVVHGQGASAPGSDAMWDRTAVAAPAGLGGFRRSLARRLLPLAPFATFETAFRVHGDEAASLSAAATAVDAHYYIGHRVAGIAAAATAADRTHAKFGADLDALFADASTDPAADPVLRSAVRIILATMLPRAAHLTAATTEIAASFAARYGVQAEIAADLAPPEAADRTTLLRLVKKAAGRP